MRNFILLLFLLSISNIIYAQNTLVGRVVTSEHTPIEGASVVVKDLQISTYTDNKGLFFIRPNAKQVGVVSLRINHLGYNSITTTVEEITQDTLTVILHQSSMMMDEVEVVSTGFQTISKERATGSFSTVNNTLFNQQVGTDILSRIPAISNSVMVSSGVGPNRQMMVRGLSTISGPKDPLIVVDNFPYDGDLNNLNPNIVENITILKDAAASSIWGARAANGVIVITTKSGRFNENISVDFNSHVTIQPISNLDNTREILSKDFIEVETELFSRGFYNNQINSASRPVLSPVVDLLDRVQKGLISESDASLQIERWKQLDARDQIKEYLYSPSINQQHFLNFQGGTERFSWLTSVGYDHNKSDLGAVFKRTNIRFRNTFNPIEALSIESSLTYTQNQNESGRLGYDDIFMKSSSFVPYMQIADENGLPIAVAKNWRSSFINDIEDERLLDWNYYPLDDWKYQTSTRSLSDLTATFGVNYKVYRGLSAAVKYQYQQQTGANTNHADINSFMARDYINRFSQVDGEDLIYNVPMGDILDKFNSVLRSNNLRANLSYDEIFGRHSIVAIAGFEIRSLNTESHQEGYYGFNSQNYTTGNVDYTKTYPNYVSGSAFINRNQALKETTTRFVSQFANAAYTFDDRYVLSTSFRRDASNLFGLKTNDQWNPFWSLGMAWKISNENFYSSDLIPYLSMRSTYGFSGNIDPAMVAVNTISYFATASMLNNEERARISNYYNPSLKWETSKMFNLALDFRFRNNRLSGSLEFYNKRGFNLFGQSPIDLTTGVDPWILRNVASMKGSGVDVELKSLNINRELKWYTILNFSFNNDRVKEYLIDRTLASQYVTGNSVPISGVQGKPVFSVFAYKWGGLDPETGEPQGILNGEKSKDYRSIVGAGTKLDDLEFFGSAIPTKFGSMINSVSYRDFSVQIGLSYKFGYWYRKGSINYTEFYNNWRGHSDFEMRWKEPGDELNTNVPVNDFTTNSQRDGFYSGSSVLIEKGDHIRLQYINFAYEINKLSRRLNTVQLFFNAQNLGVIWRSNKSNIDPDYNLGAKNIGIPPNYTLGLRLSI